jgi:hypothetical protein
MSNFHSLGNSQINYTNYIGKSDNSFTDARDINIRELYKSFKFFERLGGDRKDVRLAIKDKIPQYSKWDYWPAIKEERTIKKLVRRYEVHGERTGTRRGRLYFEVWDVDITHLAQRLPA